MLETAAATIRRSLPLILVVAMLGSMWSSAVESAQAQDTGKTAAKDSKKKSRKGKGKKDEQEEKPATMADAIGNVTPVGRGHRKLVIPQFDPETGKRKSTIRVSSVEREDEVSLRLQGLDIQEFGQDGEATMRIEVRSGYFDLTTGILTGDSYSKVSVPGQFEIEGSGLICDTSTKKVDGKEVRAQFGKMNGPVRMTIFGGSQMSLSPEEKKKPSKEKKGAK